MTRWLVLMLLAALGWGAGIDDPVVAPVLGLGGQITMGDDAPIPLGLGTNPVQWIQNGMGQVVLNTTSPTFTRATSGYDPVANAITAPGVQRTRTVTIGTTPYQASLIEGPRTNLLAAGSSDRLTSGWTPNAGAVAASAQVLPDGSLADSFVEDGTTAGHFIMQSVVKAASSLPYAMQFLIKQNAANTHPIVQATLDDNAGNGVFLRFNLATGAFNTSGSTFGAGWSAAGSTVTVVGGWYLLTLTGTSNTATTLRVLVQSNSAASYAGDSVSGWYASHLCVEQAAFPSSYISNRNLTTRSQQLANAAWTNAQLTATDNSVANPLTGAVDADTLTEDTTNAIHQCYQTPNYTATAYIGSVYLKAGTQTWAWLNINDGAVNHQCWFNLSTGVVGTVAGSTTATITALPGQPGWYRCTVSRTTAAGAGFFVIGTANADNTTTYLGSSKTVFAYGAQLEYGSTATAYWGVNGTVGGRDADNLTTNLNGLVDSRTNLLQYSEQFDNAAWVKSNGGLGVLPVVTANAGTDPNGNAYADRIQLSLGGGTTSADISAIGQTPACVAVQSNFMIWLKSNTGGSFNLSIRVDSGATVLVTPVVVTPSWRRFVIPFLAASVTAQFRIWLRGATTDGATADILAWGAQFVNTAADPGIAGYLPTAATAVSAAQTGLSTTTGTVVAIGIPYARSGVAGAGTDLAHQGGTPFAMDVGGNGFYRDINITMSAESATPGVMQQWALTWDASNIRAFNAGTQVGSVTTVSSPAPFSIVTSFTIGDIPGLTGAYNGWVAVLYYPSALPASNLLQLSSAGHL